MLSYFDKAEGEQPTLRPRANREWMILGPAMILPFLGALIYFVVFAGSPLAMIVYTAVKLFTLFFPVAKSKIIQPVIVIGISVR